MVSWTDKTWTQPSSKLRYLTLAMSEMHFAKKHSDSVQSERRRTFEYFVNDYNFICNAYHV